MKVRGKEIIGSLYKILRNAGYSHSEAIARIEEKEYTHGEKSNSVNSVFMKLDGGVTPPTPTYD